MNKIKKIAIITIILYMLLITSAFASTASITVSAARLRKDANTESDVLTKIYEGEKVEILEKNGEWYKVKYGNKIGYLKNNLIKEELGNTTTDNNQKEDNSETTKDNVTTDSFKIITKFQTKLRYQPSMMSNVIIQLETGKELTKKIELGNWIQVTDGTVTGWIIKNKTSISSDTSTVENMQKPVEKEPEKAENKVDSNKNDVSNEIEKDKEKDKVSDNRDEQKNNQAQTVTSNKKGKVNVETAKVRKTADKTSKVVGFLDYNDEITILAEEGEWYKFTEKNVEGYVHKTLVTVIGEGTVSSRGTNEDRESENKEDITHIPSESIENSKEVENSTNNEVGNKGQEVVNLAKTYLGYKYVVGGKNPETGFDCSGFTRYIYLQFDYSLGSTAAGQNNVGREVSRDDLRPGDLILFYDEAKTKIGHTGIYMSNGDFIHSANPKRGVVIDNINTNSYYNERYIVAKRIVE